MRESFRTKYDNLFASLFIDLFLQSPFKTFEVGLRRFNNSVHVQLFLLSLEAERVSMCRLNFRIRKIL